VSASGAILQATATGMEVLGTNPDTD